MPVAVAHEYCRALDKQANCQVAVSVHAVTDAASVPLQWRLFLPKEWDRDAERRRRCQVPDEVGYREKRRMAPETFDELAGWGLVPPVVVADAGYGQNAGFCDVLSERDMDMSRGRRSLLTRRAPRPAPPQRSSWPPAPARGSG